MLSAGSWGFIRSVRQTLEINFELRLSELSWNTKILKKKKKVLTGNYETNSLQHRRNPPKAGETASPSWQGSNLCLHKVALPAIIVLLGSG